jgi:RNA polymerase-binding transcription factor DksA
MITTSAGLSTALSARQLRELRAELESERTRLERSLAGTADVSPRLAARYDAIVNALRRLGDGAYGICSGCRSPIPHARLMVMPETMLCVACGPRA